MPDLSDTVAKCRIGTAKNFTLLLLLYHTQAKRLGLNPRSLIKNIPSKSEPWKAPVSEWLREMEEKRDRKAARRKARKAQS